MKTIYRHLFAFIAAVICLVCLVSPASASTLTDSPLSPENDPDGLGSFAVAAPDYKQLSVTELYAKVKECRQSLLETRLDVVKEANEAKLRLEELLKNGKQSAQSAEALRRDLDTIKEAQRVLATILSDIVNAASSAGTGAQESGAGQIKASGAASGAQQEILPSREYLESLIVLYDEKNRQLAKIVESLNGVVTLS